MSEIIKHLTVEVRPPLHQLEESCRNSSVYGGMSGRVAMNGAVTRLQGMLAERLVDEQQTAESVRAEHLERYLSLLGNPSELADQTTVDEFNSLAGEFYVPRNMKEEHRIIDAGGATYGF